MIYCCLKFKFPAFGTIKFYSNSVNWIHHHLTEVEEHLMLTFRTLDLKALSSIIIKICKSHESYYFNIIGLINCKLCPDFLSHLNFNEIHINHLYWCSQFSYNVHYMLVFFHIESKKKRTNRSELVKRKLLHVDQQIYGNRFIRICWCKWIVLFVLILLFYMLKSKKRKIPKHMMLFKLL